jgi:hypothetical protein
MAGLVVVNGKWVKREKGLLAQKAKGDAKLAESFCL